MSEPSSQSPSSATGEADRRMLLAVVLSLVVYYLWVQFFAPAPPTPEVAASTDAPPVVPAPTPSAPVVPAVEARTLPVRSDAWQGVLSSNGGAFGSVQLEGFHDPIVSKPWWTYGLERVLGQTEGPWVPSSGGQTPIQLLTPEGAFPLMGSGEPGAGAPATVRELPGGWEVESTDPQGLVVTRTLRTTDDPHVLSVHARFENRGSNAVVPWVGMADRMRDPKSRFELVVLPEAVVDGDLESVQKLEDLDPEWEGPTSWLALADRYFMAAVAFDQPLQGGVRNVVLPDGRQGIYAVVGEEPLAPGQARELDLVLYVGTKQLGALDRVGHDLDQAINRGFFSVVVRPLERPLMWLLTQFHGVTRNWGLAILALTFVVKTLFFPLTKASMESGQKMKALKPQLDQLKEKYAEDREAQSRETMKLFSENGVNPAGGCLPMLVQMPVWIALYSILGQSVELYNSSFLYLHDLTAVDPYGVLPTIYGAVFLLQQKITPQPEIDDPAQRMMLKWMPIVFTLFMYNFPSGLVLYSAANAAISVSQIWVLQRFFARRGQAAAAPQ